MRVDTSVLVTGASSGIGRALAFELAARGARLGIAARRRGNLEEVAERIAGAGRFRPVVFETDLAHPGPRRGSRKRRPRLWGRCAF